MSDTLHCPAVLALELGAGIRPARLGLSRDEAAELAACLADDLQRLLPGAADVHLVVAGGLYDAAQLLRPGWPLYSTLADLAVGARRGEGAQIIAFGTQEERWPAEVLEPERALIGDGGGMLVLPWLLLGPADRVNALGARMEQEFLAKGEAGARTADLLMRHLGFRCEHARYLTRHDLCALSCVQLEHAGFAAAWELLEAALLAPDETQDSYSARGRAWRYSVGAAQTTLPSYPEWCEHIGVTLDPGQRTIGYAGWLFELRQYAALFQAHRLPLLVDGASTQPGYVLELLDERRSDLPPPELFAHEAPGLGVVVVSVAQAAPEGPHLLAHGYPLSPDGLAALRTELSTRYRVGDVLIRLGRIQLDEEGMALDVPTPRGFE